MGRNAIWRSGRCRGRPDPKPPEAVTDSVVSSRDTDFRQCSSRSRADGLPCTDDRARTRWSLASRAGAASGGLAADLKSFCRVHLNSPLVSPSVWISDVYRPITTVVPPESHHAGSRGLAYSPRCRTSEGWTDQAKGSHAPPQKKKAPPFRGKKKTPHPGFPSGSVWFPG